MTEMLGGQPDIMTEYSKI